MGNYFVIMSRFSIDKALTGSRFFCTMFSYNVYVGKRTLSDGAAQPCRSLW